MSLLDLFGHMEGMGMKNPCREVTEDYVNQDVHFGADQFGEYSRLAKLEGGKIFCLGLDGSYFEFSLDSSIILPEHKFVYSLDRDWSGRHESK